MSPLRTCDDLRPLLGGYVLGALEPDEAEAVREHLADCAACTRRARLAGRPARAARPRRAAGARRTSRSRRRSRRRCSTASPAIGRARPAAPRRRRRRPRIAWTRPRVAVASGLVAAALTFAVMAAFDEDPPHSRSPRATTSCRCSAGRPAHRRAARSARRVSLYRVPRRDRGAPVGQRPASRAPGASTRCCARSAAGARAPARSAPTPRGASRRRLTTAARVGEYDSLRVVYRDERGHTKDVLTGRLF